MQQIPGRTLTNRPDQTRPVNNNNSNNARQYNNSEKNNKCQGEGFVTTCAGCQIFGFYLGPALHSLAVGHTCMYTVYIRYIYIFVGKIGVLYAGTGQQLWSRWSPHAYVCCVCVDVCALSCAPLDRVRVKLIMRPVACGLVAINANTLPKVMKHQLQGVPNTNTHASSSQLHAPCPKRLCKRNFAFCPTACISSAV